MTVTRVQLVEELADQTGETKATTKRFLDALINQIQQHVADSKKVTIVGFGTFEGHVNPARSGRNPSTGEQIHIAQKVRPKFRPGTAFVKMLNQEQ